MAEEFATTMSSRPSSINSKTSPFSSSFRFIRFADNSNSSPTQNNHFELDECDVVWPSEVYSDVSCGGGESPMCNMAVSGESDSLHRRRAFLAGRFGLSAALAEDGRPEMSFPAGRAVAGGVSEIFRQSAPVNVPVWTKRYVSPVVEEEAEEERLPPHLIVARSRVMNFSVFEGAGRTLKGRDLRRVRNAVFQKTGFLE